MPVGLSIAGLMLLLLAASPTLAGVGEIFIMAGLAQGTLDTETDSGAQATRLTFITGNNWQLRADLGVLRVRQEGFLPSPVGPIPGKLRGPHGAGSPVSEPAVPQTQANAGQGSGQGSGGSSNGSLSEVPSEAPLAEEAEWQSGLGDLRVAASHRLLGGGAKVFRLDLGAQVKAPTADPDKGLGTGEWDGYVGLTSEYRFWSATGFGGIGWNYLGDPAWVELNDVVDGYLGLESEPLASRWIVSGWVEGNPEVIDGLGARLALGFGVRTSGRLRWRLLGTVGLTDAAQDFSFLFGTSFGVATPTVGTRGPVR